MLQRHPEIGALFHLICTMRLSSTMTRLALNRIARAKGAETRLATPLWAGKSSANAPASVRGQQGEPAQVLFARIWAAQTAILATFLYKIGQSLPLLVAPLFGSCVGVLHPLLRLLRQRPASWLIAVGGKTA